jgi:hypothetical protein
MSFWNEGYLAAEVDGYERMLRHRYAATIDVYVEASRIVLTLLRELRAHPASARDHLVFALASNTFSHCQAAVMLCFRGMKMPGRASLRCALESLFSLGALVRAKKNLRRVRLKYLLEFKKQIEFLVERNAGKDGHGKDRSSDLRLAMREIKRYRKDRRQVTVKELATLARMTNEYEVRYFLYSEAVHPDPVALLRRHAPADQNVFRFEPEDDVRLQMGEVLETMGKTARALVHHFKVDGATYDAFQPRLIAAINAISSEPMSR